MVARKEEMLPYTYEKIVSIPNGYDKRKDQQTQCHNKMIHVVFPRAVKKIL